MQRCIGQVFKNIGFLSGHQCAATTLQPSIERDQVAPIGGQGVFSQSPLQPDGIQILLYYGVQFVASVTII